MRNKIRLALLCVILSIGWAQTALAAGITGITVATGANAAAAPTSMQVSARGRRAAQIAFLPPTVNWGDVEVPATGTTRDTTVTVRNIGQRPWTGSLAFLLPCSVFTLTSPSELSIPAGGFVIARIRLTLGSTDTLSYACTLRAQ